MQVSTIGLDLAKNVFQVHGITATEEVVCQSEFDFNKFYCNILRMEKRNHSLIKQVIYVSKPIGFDDKTPQLFFRL